MDETTQAVKDIVAFIGYCAPLLFFVALLKGSSALLGQAHGAADKFLRGAAGKAKEPLGRTGLRIAARAEKIQNPRFQRAGKAVSSVFGAGTRSAWVQQKRKEQEEAVRGQYLASVAQRDEGLVRRAAGMAGAAGVSTVTAGAVSVAQAAEDKKLSEATTLLAKQLQDTAVSSKDMAKQLEQFLTNPHLEGSWEVKGASGQVMDLRQFSPDLMKAALHTVAGEGEVNTIYAARMSSGTPGFSNPEQFQSMVDNVIYRNQGTIKSKGAFDLTKNYGMAYGRGKDENSMGRLIASASQDLAPATQEYNRVKQAYDSNEALLNQAITAGKTEDINTYREAKGRLATQVEAQQDVVENIKFNISRPILQSAVNTMAESSAEDIAGTKESALKVRFNAIAGRKDRNGQLIPGTQILPSGSNDEETQRLQQKLSDSLQAVQDNRNLLGRISQVNYEYAAAKEVIQRAAPQPAPTPAGGGRGRR